jgi:hypothetical protein
MLVHNQKWQTTGTSTMQDSSKSNTCQQQLSRGRKKKRTARNMLVHNKKWQPHGSSTMQDSSKINKADPGSGRLALALNLTRDLKLLASCSSSFLALSLSLSLSLSLDLSCDLSLSHTLSLCLSISGSLSFSL